MASLPNTSYLSYSKTAAKDDYIDPAEYLLTQNIHHDCVFVVGSDNNQVEKIGGVKCSLASHSSVFRHLLIDNNTEVRITDVSPQVFKLILIHVYGGELPDLDRSTAAQLALAADLYNIPPLVTRACRIILPKSVADVFPALVCVANLSCPCLEPVVNKIVQESTLTILSSEQFLDLDARCIEYICRQDRLSVTEVQLWRALVLWAEHKAATGQGKTATQHLQIALPYIRLATFSPHEIIKEVIPSKVLTPEQAVELLSAVTLNQPLKLPGFYNGTKIRELLCDTGSYHTTALSPCFCPLCNSDDQTLYGLNFEKFTERIIFDCACLSSDRNLLFDEEEEY